MTERPVKADKQSRLVSTELKYRKSASARFKEHRRSGYANTVEGMVAWAQEKANSVRSSTWGLYRAAMVFTLERDAEQDGRTSQERDGLRALATRLRGIGSANDKSVDRTSSKKRKSLPADKLHKILVELQRRPSKYSELLALFMWVNPITDLRPVEWISASLVEDETTHRVGLQTVNAKATNGRANGKTRILW